MARETKKIARGIRWRLWFAMAVLAVLFVGAAAAAMRARQYILADAQFVLSRDHRDALVIEGLRYTSRAKVQRVFAADFGRSILSVPLDERRRRLLAIDWVEDAAVSRIWPGRLAVRVRERQPVAFVFFRSGVALIDAQGVLLDLPAQSQFSFPVLNGIREDQTEVERQKPVRALLRLLDDLGPLGKDVSEVNAADPDDIGVVAQADGRTVELLLGDGNYARRFQNFLSHYPEIHRRTPAVRVFDLRLDDRITGRE